MENSGNQRSGFRLVGIRVGHGWCIRDRDMEPKLLLFWLFQITQQFQIEKKRASLAWNQLEVIFSGALSALYLNNQISFIEVMRLYLLLTSNYVKISQSVYFPKCMIIKQRFLSFSLAFSQTLKICLCVGFFPLLLTP